MTYRPIWLYILTTTIALSLSPPVLAKEDPAVPKVEVIQPAPAESLSGTIVVTVKITASEDGQVPASIRVGIHRLRAES